MPILSKEQITGIAHLAWSFFLPLAAILLNNYVIDIFFIYHFLGVSLSWVYLHGECLITYLVKKAKDPDYKVGDNPHSMEDFLSIVSEPVYTYIILPVMLFISAFAVYVTFKRNPTLLPMGFVYVVIATHIAYIVVLRRPRDSFARKIVQEIFKVITIVVVTLVTRNLLSK